MLRIPTGRKKAIYKHCQEFEPRATAKQIEVVVRIQIEPRTLDWESDGLTTQPPCLLTNCHSFSNIVEAEVSITNSFSIGGHILFHLVPLRVPKCLLNDVKQTSCDHAHQDSAKRKRNLENQLFKLLLKILENKDCLLLHYIAKNQIQACTFSFLLSHNTLMLHDISIPLLQQIPCSLGQENVNV